MIRPVTIADAAKIADIYNDYVTQTIVTFEEEAVSVDEILRRIADHLASGLPWLVLEIAGAAIGYAYAGKWRARPAYRHSVETTIYLARDAWGKGFGRLLYTELLSDLTAAGFHSAIGGIALPNAASVGLHEALGFKKVAHFQEVGYKFNQWIDVGFWQRML